LAQDIRRRFFRSVLRIKETNRNDSTIMYNISEDALKTLSDGSFDHNSELNK